MQTHDYKQMTVDELDEHHINAVMWAAWVGDVDYVHVLLAKGADPNAQPQGNPPALYWAMETYCKPEMVNALLAAGSDVNRLGKGEHTILFRAVMNTDVEIIRMLVRAGAEVNTQLDEGGDPTAANYDGTTPLMMAALRIDGADILPILLEAGADVNVRDRKGRTALMHAQERGTVEAVRLLQEAVGQGKDTS